MESMNVAKDTEEDREILEDFPPWKLQELGLGRGVNGTDPRPWVNKSSLQIRDIIMQPISNSTDSSQQLLKSSLIGTNEGGIVHHFVQEVTSIKELKAMLDTSISVPNSPVTVGVGADLIRSMTKTQKAIGQRVLNRTVTFKAEYQDNAENLLAKYILQNVGVEKEDSETYLKKLRESSKLKAESYFKAFVDRYRITHYVSSITLGASYFTVQSESEYHKEAGIAGEIGFQQVAQIKVSAFYVSKLLKKSKNVHAIGKLGQNGTVEKEAVVDVKIEPISSLFQSDEFRDCMQSVLDEFFHKKDYGKEGPYLISCNDGLAFLKVVQEIHGQATVMATTKIEQASQFYVILTDEGDYPYEFYIGWQKSKTGEMRYLNAPVSITGYHCGPLTFESRGAKNHSRFSLNSRLIDYFCGLFVQGNDNINPDIWFKGSESYLIMCSRRRWCVDGFLAVQRNIGSETEEYRTTSVSNPRTYDGENLHMTFQLHPRKKWNDLGYPIISETRHPPSTEARSLEVASTDLTINE